MLGLVFAVAIVGESSTGNATFTLPDHPTQCEKIMVKHLVPGTLKIIASAPILGNQEVIITMLNQILELQYRDGEWRDPIVDCQVS